MAFETKVLADSISDKGIRLTTVEATYPRIVHSELMTHRVFSRNSASTRAIPLANHLSNLLFKPFIPEKFGINQPGMQAYKHLEGMKHEQAVEVWLTGRDRALTTTLELMLGREVMADLCDYDPAHEHVGEVTLMDEFDNITAALPKSTDKIDLGETSMLNVHKQLAGRGLEGYMWHTVIVSATEWDNFFALRDHPDAQGEIATMARRTKAAIDASEPQLMRPGEWHLPLVDKGEFESFHDGIKASAARCAAVSYNRHNRKSFDKEVERYQQLTDGGHMSPLEHQATPFDDLDWGIVKGKDEVVADMVAVASLSGRTNKHYAKHAENNAFLGNLHGWIQHRKQVTGEQDFSQIETASK